MKWYQILYILGCYLLTHNPSVTVDGHIDTSFDEPYDYVLQDDSFGYDHARDFAPQQGRKIIVTGYMTNNSNNDLMALCFDPNGNLYTDFGIHGTSIYTSQRKILNGYMF